MNKQNGLTSVTKKFKKHLYGVIYLDILGQKELMRKLESGKVKPEDEEKMQTILTYINQLLKNLTDFKKVFTSKNKQNVYDYLVNITKLMQSEPLMDGVTIERVETSLRELAFGIQQFSDSTLLYARLDGNDSYMARNLFGMLMALLPATMLEAFTKGIFVRGSIAIGNAWEINKNNLYGPVIHDAYIHEEKIAKWPRIVISKAAIDFLKTDFKLLEQLLPKENPTCLAIRERFINGVDGVPQLNPIPNTLYLNGTKENCDTFRITLIGIVEQINKLLIDLKKSYDDNEIDINEYSKRLTRYRILKRDLLCGMTRFETTMYYMYDERSKDTPFELPEWLKKECPNDLSFITIPEKIFF